jgi:sulfate/thiosulfate transport system permease protein
MSAISAPRRVLPGFGISLGLTLMYLGIVLCLPIAALVLYTAQMSWTAFVDAVTHPRVVASYRLSFGASLVAATINLIFGALVAWVLVRYRFPGRRAIDALVDLPFAMPTAVAGIALVTLYAGTGWVGQYFELLGLRIAYTQLGVIVALTYIGLPFVVRTVQPVLEDLERETEEASAALGASRLTTVRRVMLPALLPALLTGFALAFARALGEYGSVIFISGNLPYRTEITPLLIVVRTEQFNHAAAAAIGTVMLAAAFVLLLGINGLQWWAHRRINPSGPA